MLLVLALAASRLLYPMPQEPGLEEREALYERLRQAPEAFRRPAVEARWLEDGSAFTYRRGGEVMILDPDDGQPRRATAEERQREAPRPSRVRLGRSYTEGGGRSARLEDGDLVVAGAGIDGDLRLSDDASDDIRWTVTSEGWSADGSSLFATRLDARRAHRLPLVDYTQALETWKTVPYIKTGTAFAVTTLVIFHLPGGERVDVDPGLEDSTYLFPLGWRQDADELLYLRMSRDAKRLDLMAADPATGASRVVLTEESDTFVGGLDFITGGWRQVFHAIDGADGFLWLSERDGWRHVYHHDYDGALLARVTAGGFPVERVVAVDRERDRVFLLARGEPRRYDTHLYRTGLGGGPLLRLTDAPGEHQVQLSPSKLRFLDTHSSLERPPRTELRDADGELVRVLHEADASALAGSGWTPPEAFVVKAADGVTELYGALFKPVYFDPAVRYPVIDFLYSGPFITVAPNDFGLSTHLAPYAQAMAQMGFITFIVDPRGTTGRSKAFQDASYGRIGEIEIPDHVSTLRQLAATRPFMDLGRVGVYGHSWGGYFALRAMLTAPEVFRAGVAGAPGELTEAAPINEPYMGLPADNPGAYAAALNAPLAGQLQGELLLLHGTADVNAPFSTTMRMVQALIEADKDFDLLVLPGAAHGFQGAHSRYAERRIRDFFLEHLRGEARVAAGSSAHSGPAIPGKSE